MPIGIRAAKRLEEVRDGQDPYLRIWLSGLAFVQDQRFCCLTASVMDITIPRSHWADRVLRIWGISDLQILEIGLPSSNIIEFSVAKDRLARAEPEYRVGDYPQVLSSLRLAFEAVAKHYRATRVDKNLFDKMLAGSHGEIRTKLRDSFYHIYDLLNMGPHEPIGTEQTPLPISRDEARFALITTHAIFEFFSRNGWPGV